MSDIKMIVLAKDDSRQFVIRADKAKEFIEECNKNVVTDEFLEKCEKASKLFRRVD